MVGTLIRMCHLGLRESRVWETVSVHVHADQLAVCVLTNVLTNLFTTMHHPRIGTQWGHGSLECAQPDYMPLRAEHAGPRLQQCVADCCWGGCLLLATPLDVPC